MLGHRFAKSLFLKHSSSCSNLDMLVTSDEKWLIQDSCSTNASDGLIGFPMEMPIPVRVLATSQLSADHSPM